jgi:hypothetical protein
MGHIVNPRKLQDDGVDWATWMADVRQVRKELASQAAASNAKVLPFRRSKITRR